MFLARVRRFSLGASLLTPLVYWPQLYDPEFLQSAWLATWATLACAASLALPAPDDPARRRPLRLILLGWGLIAVMGVIDLPLVTDTFLWRRALLHIGALLALTRAAGDEIVDDMTAELWISRIALVSLGASLLAMTGAMIGETRHWIMNGHWVGPFGNPNWAGAFAAVSGPLLLFAAFGAHTRGSLWRTGSAASGAALLAVASGSRASWLGLLLGIVVSLWFGVRMRGWNAFVKECPRRFATIAAASLALLVASECIRPQPAIDATSRTLSIRTEIWESTSRLISHHPTTGVGLGQFSVRFPPYRSPAEYAASGELTTVGDPHNSILGRIAEGGWPAAFGIVFVLGGILMALRRVAPGIPAAWIVAGLAGAIAAGWTVACFTEVILRPTISPVLAFLGPLAVGASAPDKAGARQFGLPLLGALVLVVGGSLTWFAGWTPTVAAYYLANAQESEALAWAPDWTEAIWWYAEDHRGVSGALDRAVELRPDDPALLNDRGCRSFGSEAERDFRAALRIAPTFRLAWFNLGEELRLEHRYEESLAAFKKAAGEKRDEGQACVMAARLCARLNRPDDALEWLRDAKRCGMNIDRESAQVPELRRIRELQDFKRLMDH